MPTILQFQLFCIGNKNVARLHWKMLKWALKHNLKKLWPDLFVSFYEIASKHNFNMKNPLNNWFIDSIG